MLGTMWSRVLIVVAVLLLWPFWAIVKIRFAAIHDEAKHIDEMQKWGGD